jgi:hypothetical protein
MKRILLTLIALLAMPATALAQQPLAGSSLRLGSQSSVPNNLVGNSGVFNLNGRFTWHTGGTDQTVLSCAACTTNVLPYFDTLSGITALPSAWFYDSTDKQFCGAGASNPYCVRLDDTGGVASIGYHIGIADGNYVQNDSIGTKIYHNGNNFAQTLGSGASEEWQVKGIVESTTGGFKLPTGAIQSVPGGTAPVTLVDGTTVPMDCATSDTFVLTIAGNRTLTVSNIGNSTAFMLQVIQGAGGSHTMTWPASFHWAGGSAPTLTTTAGQADIVSCKSFNASTLMCVANANFTP